MGWILVFHLRTVTFLVIAYKIYLTKDKISVII